MIAVYRKELRSYFTSLTGYMLIAIYLLFAGIFVTVYNLFGGTPSIEVTYADCVIVLLIVIPLLTMRSIAGERHQKTGILLSSLPIKTADYIAGKYLAMLTLLALPVFIVFCYSAILSFYGEINLLSALLSTFALFLLAAALSAIGLFLSSLTDNVLVAGALTFGVLLMIYFMPTLILLLPATAIGSLIVFSIVIVLLVLLLFKLSESLNFALIAGVIAEIALLTIFFIDSSLLEGAAADFFGFLSFTEHFDLFPLYGIFDLSSIVYFISVAILFLLFTILSMEKKRWH